MAGTLLVECGLVSSSQLAEALEHQRTHGGALDEVVSKLFDLPLLDLRAAMSGDPSGIDVGAILFATNIVDEETLAEARKRSRATGQPVGPVLVEMGAVTRLELASALADQWSDSPALILPAANSRDKSGNPEVDDLKFAMRQLEASVRAARVTDGSDASQAEIASREAELAERLAAVELALAQPVEVDAAFLAEFQATVRRTHEIEAALSGLAPAEALATFSAAADEVRGLQGALDALAERVEQGLTAEAFEPVIERVDELAAQVDGLASGEPGPTVEEIVSMRAVIEELAARPMADPGGAEALAQRIEELAATLPGLDVRDELAGLHAQLDELAARPVVDEGLAGRVDELSARVHELLERPAGDPSVDERLDELARSVEALSVLAEASSGAEGLQDALTGLAGQIEETRAGTAGTGEAIAELRGQLDGVAAQLESDRGGLDEAFAGLSGLAERIAELDARPAVDPALAETVAALAVQFEEIASRPSGDPELGERLAQLADRVDGLAVDALGPAAAAAVADVTARLDALAEAKAEDAERLEALRARIEETRIEIAEAARAGEPDPAIHEGIEETRLAIAELAARIEVAASIEDVAQLRAELPAAGLDDEAARRLAELEERIAALGAAASDATAVEDLKARLDEIAGAADGQVAAVLARLEAVEATGGSGPGSEDLAELRNEVSALTSSIESVRTALAEEIERLGGSWASERKALEDRFEAIADSSITGAVDGGAGSSTAPAAPELKKLAREMERLQDRVVEQERSLVEHFARREKALTEKLTGGTDVGQRLSEITRLVDEQRSRIDRLSTSGGGGGGGASGDELATLKDSLFAKLEKLASSIDWRFQRLEGEAGGGGPSASAARTELHAKVDELTRVVEQLAGVEGIEMPDLSDSEGDVYLALVPTATGHQLVELRGELPAVGDSIVTPVSRGELNVIAVGTSPLPGDERACIFVEPAEASAKATARA